MDRSLLSLEESVLYSRLKKDLLAFTQIRTALAERLKSVDEELTKAVDLKWSLEEKMIPVKIVPTRRVAGESRRPKLVKKRKKGFTREDEALLLEEAKKRGYV